MPEIDPETGKPKKKQSQLRVEALEAKVQKLEEQLAEKDKDKDKDKDKEKDKEKEKDDDWEDW